MRYLIFFLALSANAQEAQPNDHFAPLGTPVVVTPAPFSDHSTPQGYHVEIQTSPGYSTPMFDHLLEDPENGE